LVLLFALPALLWTSGGLTLFAQSREAPLRVLEPCQRVALRPQPSWTESAAWSSSGEDLIVVDTLYNKALRYSKAGRTTGSLPDAVESMLERLYPLRIRSENSSFILQLANSRFMRLDHDYRPQEMVDLRRDTRRPDGWYATYLFQWAPAGKDLLGYGDYEYQESADQYVERSGILRIPLGMPASFEVLDIPLSAQDDSTRVLYRLGYPYFSSLGSDGVVLAMYENPRIYLDKEGGGIVSLEAFPDEIRERPRIEQRFDLPADFPLVMREVEQKALPAGIFGWKDFLYLLHRRPQNGGTLWSLTKIDPREDRIVGTSTLNTSANHLTAVPGEKEWAFLEKGPVEAFGKQNVRSVLLVPSETIEHLDDGNQLCSDL
jgi:hypothetical protein